MRNIFWLISLVLAAWMGTSSLSAQTLDWAAFQKQVLENHPLSRRSNLLLDQAKAMQVRARGGFDPKLYGGYSNKNFNGKTYFQFAEAGVKLPTWAGLELKGAYNYASGDFLNNENKLPKNGQANIGLEWSLGQGLLYDERRAGLAMSKIAFDLNDAERRALQNDLMLEASKSYWDWVLATQSLQFIADMLQQAQIRHSGLVESFRQGDKPAIDTLESFILVQSRLLDQQFAQTEAQNSAIGLAVFLWTDNDQATKPENLPNPPVLTAATIGETTSNVETAVQQSRTSHPEILMYQSKLRQLATERRLKQEKRKPVVNVSYSLLGNGWEFFPGNNGQGVGVLANDIKWGLDVSYPLLNRKARGDYQLTLIKVRQTELEWQQKMESVAAKVRQYTNEVQNLNAQVRLFQEITINYRRLFEGEQEKFQQGESSVFLLNTREQKWLDTQLKLLKLQAQLQKAAVGVLWSMGALAPEN